MAHSRLAKCLVAIGGLTALVLATVAGAETPQKAPEVQPIAGLWLAPMSQAQWLETLNDVQSDTWAWVMEKQVRIPTPDQAMNRLPHCMEWQADR